MSKTGLVGAFPTVFGLERFFRKIFNFYIPLMGLISVHNGLDRHHGHLANPLVRLLFTHHPISRLPCQAVPIRIHEMPRSIKKSSDHLHGARIKAFVCTFLRVLELSFVNLPVPVFAPTLVL